MLLTSKLRAAKARIMEKRPILRAAQTLAEKITLVDVGAANGLQKKFRPYKRSITPILFEPNPAEAATLRATLAGFDNPKIIPFGLSDEPGPQILNIGKHHGCTSMLRANMGFLSDYPIAELFRSDRTAIVNCERYDTLFAIGAAPAPDIIKIDAEGYESKILDGFGNLLKSVLGIETEAWFYPAYQNQALLHNLIEKLQSHGLRLRRLETVPGFSGDLVCVNAYFTMPSWRAATLPAAQKAKFDIMTKVWRLERYS